MSLSLFEQDWGENKSPVDTTEITTTILYFEKKELKEFKKLCKSGIREAFGKDFQTKGNISDLLLMVLKEKYGHL